MNPRKLAFGDIVYSTFNQGNVRIRKVVDLEYSAYYNPIELTGDVLEKNGFVGNKFDRYDFANDGMSVMVRMGDEMRIYVRTKACSMDHYERVEYVHEFQQLLRAAGMKDFANNFIV